MSCRRRAGSGRGKRLGWMATSAPSKLPMVSTAGTCTSTALLLFDHDVTTWEVETLQDEVFTRVPRASGDLLVDRFADADPGLEARGLPFEVVEHLVPKHMDLVALMRRLDA